MGPNEWSVSTAVQNVESPMMSQVSYDLLLELLLEYIQLIDGLLQLILCLKYFV